MPNAAKVVRPPEEVIHLDGGNDGEVPVERPARDRPSAKGGGKGKGKFRKEPKGKKHKGLDKTIEKYAREGASPKALKVTGDKKLATKVKQRTKADREAAFQLAKAEVLQTAESGFVREEKGEDSRRLTQQDIISSAGVGVARKHFSFSLPYGPYSCSFTRNGQHLLVGGKKGHVAMLHCESMELASELHVKETVRDVQTLHNQNMFAVAQKKYIFIYDNQGIELHCIKKQKCPLQLDFLPYHFLLVSTGDKGELTYRDVSYGVQVAEHKTHLGPTTCMRQNPKNAVMHLGHTKGLVTLWTPTVKEPVVKLFCHSAQVTSLAVSGNYMVTSGSESKWKVWDLRTYKEVHSMRTFGHAPSSIDVSDTGLVAIGHGSHFEVWKDLFTAAKPKRPYITEEYPSRMISSVRFRPFEDVCAVGHTDGFGSLIVPGAGKANFDSFEANPFETKNQRREREVQTLLEKLQPDSIMLNPDRIGQIDRQVVKAWKEEAAQKEKEEAAEAAKNEKASKKMRGRNKVGNRMKRKALKQGEDQRQRTKERLDGEGDEDDFESDDDDDDDDDGGSAGRGPAATKETGKKGAEGVPAGVGSALGRFYGKRQRKT
eukprot:TRINITY_DN20939_c1_g1_i1.p1 TRINITY_DN20939_c1_g1~~TRINITY_DN20939_c1_g1_i1.p1  ORF type:complete len:616 (+),score=186.28 TRINITY_DN20939_c1_g1_i1:51-1850(+)